MKSRNKIDEYNCDENKQDENKENAFINSPT